MKLIDVSQYNGNINWEVVDCDAVIIRLGFRGYSVGGLKADNKWKRNALKAKINNKKIGYYFVTQALNESEAIAEADFCVELLKESNLEPELPIFFDSEYSTASNKNGRADKIEKEKRTKCAIAFSERILQHGYKVGIYASTSWYKDNFEVALLLDYYLWVAQYSSKCTAQHRIDIWQYSSSSKINGISGNVDDNIVYCDFSLTENKEVSAFELGNYKLLYNMNVRVDGDINSRKKNKNELTFDGQRHAEDNGTLIAGTIVTIKEIIEKDDYFWGKCPSGWIAIAQKKNNKTSLNMFHVKQ